MLFTAATYAQSVDQPPSPTIIGSSVGVVVLLVIAGVVVGVVIYIRSLSLYLAFFKLWDNKYQLKLSYI